VSKRLTKTSLVDRLLNYPSVFGDEETDVIIREAADRIIELEAENLALHNGACSARVCAAMLKDKNAEILELHTECNRLRSDMTGGLKYWQDRCTIAETRLEAEDAE